MIVSAYCRVSTDSSDQTNSYENQQSYFNREIEAKGHTLFKIYKDFGLTGTKLSNRPEFEEMLTDAGIDIKVINTDARDKRLLRQHTVYELSDRKPKFNEIWIKNTSRFARNTLSYTLITLLRQKHVNVYFIEQNINTSDLAQDLLYKLISVFDEEESKDKSLKVRSGMAEGAKKGMVKTNGRLFGYNYIQSENRLEIIPEEAEIIKIIYELYNADKGIRQILNYLNEHNLFTRTGKPFCKSTVRRILDNEKYTGCNNPLKWDTGIVMQKNSYAKIRDEYKVINSDKIPAIISKELFDQCKSKLEAKVSFLTQKGIYKGVSKYSGLIYCGKCGKPYYCNRDKGRVFYNCGTKKMLGIKACDNPNINQDELDKYFETQANGGFAKSFEIAKTVGIQRIFNEIINQYKTIDEDNSDEVFVITEKINELRDNLNAYRELYITSKIDRNILKEKIDNIENNIQVLQIKCESLTKNNIEIINKILEIYDLSVKISNIKDYKTEYTYDEVIKEFSRITIMQVPLFFNNTKVAYVPEIKKIDQINSMTRILFSVLLNEYINYSEIEPIINEVKQYKNKLLQENVTQDNVS